MEFLILFNWIEFHFEWEKSLFILNLSSSSGCICLYEISNCQALDRNGKFNFLLGYKQKSWMNQVQVNERQKNIFYSFISVILWLFLKCFWTSNHKTQKILRPNRLFLTFSWANFSAIGWCFNSWVMENPLSLSLFFFVSVLLVYALSIYMLMLMCIQYSLFIETFCSWNTKTKSVLLARTKWG